MKGAINLRGQYCAVNLMADCPNSCTALVTPCLPAALLEGVV